MTEADYFILEACEQHGFDAIYNSEDELTHYEVRPEILIAMIKRARKQGQDDCRPLLEKAAGQFRYYEQNHRATAQRWEAEPWTVKPPQQQIDDTIQKADVNAALAQEIEEFLETC